MVEIYRHPTLRRAKPAIADFDRPQLSLRTEPELGIAKICFFDLAIGSALAATMGIVPPTPGAQVLSKELAIAWLAPTEWLLTGSEPMIVHHLENVNRTQGTNVLTVDLSHSQASFTVSGAGAAAAISAHCPLDIWPGMFFEGSVARSLLGEARVFIARLEDSKAGLHYRLIVDQTMANYAARLLGFDEPRTGATI